MYGKRQRIRGASRRSAIQIHITVYFTVHGDGGGPCHFCTSLTFSVVLPLENVEYLLDAYNLVV